MHENKYYFDNTLGEIVFLSDKTEENNSIEENEEEER